MDSESKNIYDRLPEDHELVEHYKPNSGQCVILKGDGVFAPGEVPNSLILRAFESLMKSRVEKLR